MKPGRASHILRAAHTFRKRPHWKEEAPTWGPRASFRTPWTAGRDARPMARPIRLRTFYVLLGSRRLGLDGLVHGLVAELTVPEADRAVRRRPGSPGLPASPGTVPTALGRRRCTPPGSQALVHFCAHHTLVTAHTALSTTHGTVPVASRRRRSQPGVGLDLFVCMYSLSPHIVRFKHVSMRW